MVLALFLTLAVIKVCSIVKPLDSVVSALGVRRNSVNLKNERKKKFNCFFKNITTTTLNRLN